VPTYLLAVGIATGSVTVGAYYQLLLIMIYGVEQVLLGVALPLIYSFCMLTVVNGIWIEEKLTLLVEFLEKIIGWILKASLGLVTGISIFQAVLTPALDSVKKGVLQKVVSAIPGIGNAADGVVELVLGSAVVIKNSVGMVLLLLLLLLCAAPLFRIFLTAVLLKAAAAFMGIVSDKRITTCANRTGDAGILLFKTTGTALLLFLITIAVVAATTNGGS
jgi:stage III sporulation protein AE